MPITYGPYGCNCIPAYNAGADNFALKPECLQWRTVNCGRPGTDWEYGTRQLSSQEQYAQGSFSGCNFPQKATADVIRGWSPERGCYQDCPKGTALYTRPSDGVVMCAKQLTDEWNPGRFFTEIGVAVAQNAARVAGAIATGGTSIAIEAAQQVIDIYEEENSTMGIDLGGIFGGVATALGGLNSGSYLSALSGVGQIGQSFFAQQPSYAATPSYSMPSYGIVPYSQPAPQPMAQPVGAFGVAGRAIAVMTAPILAKIAVKLGLRSRPSLTRAMEMVRKAAKLLTSPEAVATALGITVAELATLITTSNSRKRRRMNPANSKALRRAARRIKSFHRLCTHTDVLKSRGRRSSFKSACGTCKRSPCRC